MTSPEHLGVFDTVCSIADSKWVLIIKQKVDGSIDKHIVRLVARGFSQNPEDYGEITSQIVDIAVIRYTLVAQQDTPNSLPTTHYRFLQISYRWEQFLGLEIRDRPLNRSEMAKAISKTIGKPF